MKTSVYFITAGPFVKIGCAASTVTRMDELQVGCPYCMEIAFEVPGDYRDEMAFHWHFLEYRVRGEWFRNEGRLKELLDRVLTPEFDEAAERALLSEVNKVWGVVTSRRAAVAHRKALLAGARTA